MILNFNPMVQASDRSPPVRGAGYEPLILEQRELESRETPPASPLPLRKYGHKPKTTYIQNRVGNTYTEQNATTRYTNKPYLHKTTFISIYRLLVEGEQSLHGESSSPASSGTDFPRVLLYA